MQRTRSLRERGGSGSRERAGPRFSVAALLLLSIAPAWPACGGGNKDAGAPNPSLAASRAAQDAFRRVHVRWLELSDAERHRLEGPLSQVIAQHGDDPKANVARVYLAWLMVNRGRLADAERLLAQVRRTTPGSTRDFGVVVEAKIALRSGDPVRALQLLEPLSGKLIDADERNLHGEQRVVAAIAARRHADALAYMLEWLADSRPEDGEAVRERITRFMTGIPAGVVEDAYTRLRQEQARLGSESSRAEAREWLQKSFGERLVRVALSTSDSALAARLIESDNRELRRGDRGAELVRLAARGRVVPRVVGRQVGLVLSTSNPELSRRSAEVAMGVTRALGLPESASRDGAVGLATADDADDGMAKALARLAAEGATVLLASLDAKDASVAAEHAERVGIPVILFAAPEKPSSRAFDVSPSASAEAALLTRALKQRQLTPVATVGPLGTPCAREPSVGTTRFPIAAWQKERVAALVLLGDESCAREVLRESRNAGFDPAIALGAEAGGLFGDIPRGNSLAVRAGYIPVRPDDELPQTLKDYIARSGRAPSWYGALGYDAATLAATAVAKLPLLATDDPDTVADYHRAARESLLKAEAPLWTTQARGFSGKLRLERRLTIVSGQDTK